ncbi:MAG: flavodoxin reductase [Chitinophagales bacterium]|nr:flavodoxin reductase [Chitinophagales bacterium]
MNGTWQDENFIQILETEYLTHDVKRFKVTKPEGYQFIPGEATDIVIDLPEWKGNRHAFTFTGLNEWDFLEFTIKINRHRNRFTNKLDQLKVGDGLIIHDSFGAFKYQGEGIFIAGGSGITPFIAILRQLEKDEQIGNNTLLFSNKTVGDIILKDEFEKMLGNRFLNTITREDIKIYPHQRINQEYLAKHVQDFSQYFYICGKRKMMDDIKVELMALGADENKIVTEMDF